MGVFNLYFSINDQDKFVIVIALTIQVECPVRDQCLLLSAHLRIRESLIAVF